MQKFSIIFVLLIFFLLLGGCGQLDKTCTPGKQEACDCSDGTKSVQVCNDEGSGFEKCQCDSGENIFFSDLPVGWW